MILRNLLFFLNKGIGEKRKDRDAYKAPLSRPALVKAK